MTKVCPQRIIKEAIRLLNECAPSIWTVDGSMEEEISNNIAELEGLEKALARDGIINIQEWRE